MLKSASFLQIAVLALNMIKTILESAYQDWRERKGLPPDDDLPEDPPDMPS